jgi:hypothetical protein
MLTVTDWLVVCIPAIASTLGAYVSLRPPKKHALWFFVFVLSGVLGVGSTLMQIRANRVEADNDKRTLNSHIERLQSEIGAIRRDLTPRSDIRCVAELAGTIMTLDGREFLPKSPIPVNIGCDNLGTAAAEITVHAGTFIRPFSARSEDDVVIAARTIKPLLREQRLLPRRGMMRSVEPNVFPSEADTLAMRTGKTVVYAAVVIDVKDQNGHATKEFCMFTWSPAQAFHYCRTHNSDR